MLNPLPLNALRALHAVARAGALAPAAEVLGVSVGAVSQHIRKLEARTGRTLFERTAKGLVATPELIAALPHLDAGFEALSGASTVLMADTGKVLNVTVANVFASRWLVWRLADFSSRHPDIELRLVTTAAIVDLTRPDIDCGIRFGSGDWPGTDAILLGARDVFPVCAPDLAKRLKTYADLSGIPVIRDTATMLSWADWLEAAGVGSAQLSGPTFDDPALAFDAAIAGQGVLLVVGAMADDALTRGQLVRPFDLAVPSENGYWLVSAKGQELPARVKKFRDWLFAEMSAGAGTRA